MKKNTPKQQQEPAFIGIDYHKRYSVYCVIDAAGEVLERGRIEHVRPEDFVDLVKRWPQSCVVFETSVKNPRGKPRGINQNNPKSN